ncbi:RagB/SusD family nutrient uptake outer membrane protein [Mucilaginibacter sp. PAMB04168]|uniref:RagB/SusD family nutrient uptake outer membrane protein n=1 Tax=Mucilaginibacter sp. PAMB04168 TaxID=3138567 RepID=UPI0031F634F3
MKNKLIYIVALAFTFSVGCKKELNQTPISTATTETFFASNNDFLQAVNAVYADLRTYPDRMLNLSETRSDNLYAVADGPRDWEPINNFARTISGNPYIQEAWNTNFNGIYRANTVLNKLETNGNVITDANLKTRLTAEARFLRAFFYFDLVRWFGKVPIADKVYSSAEATTIPRSGVAAVYNFILADLKFAADNLPDTYTAAADKGRATKWAAKGIMALVYMTRSGPTYNIDGPGLATNDWQVALDLLNEVINSKRFNFLTSYADIFSYSNENNAEVVFNVEYSTLSNPVVGSTFAWLLVPDTYFTSIGKAVQGGLLIRPVSTDLVNTYATNDIRKPFNIYTAGYTAPGIGTESRPFFKKYLDISKVPNNRVDWPINYIVMRYTDVLMLKAECILRGASGSQADVDLIVNQVRSRAGLTTPVTGTTIPQLMEERRREFAAEGLRWHDLVRSGLVTTVIPAWDAKEDVSNSIAPFNNNYIIYPVPQAELNVTPGLYTQNPGY